MPATTEKWDIFELALPCAAPGNPFTGVTLTADFTQDQRRVTVHGFYDGADVFRLRFMPEQEGAWHYVTHSNIAALDGQTGELWCTPAANHGPVRVAEGVHFAYADGTPYFPVGTTCYVWNLQGDALEERTLRTLSAAPFNKIRFCVFPKRYRFNQNEPPCYPFEGQPGNWNFQRFNPAYFQHLEQRILALRALGIEADLILFHPYDSGAWGFDRMPAEVNDRYLAYLAARLAACRNLWWSFANEYDLMPAHSLVDWDRYFQIIQSLDPYNHLRSIHNCRPFYDHNHPWVTHCSVQHWQLSLAPAWMRQYGKPVVVDECGYEGDIQLTWGDLSPEEMVIRFWLGFASGAYVGHGETYLDPADRLWWSKGGELRGESPARIAFLRQIIEQAPGCGLWPLKRLDPTLPAPADPRLAPAKEALRIFAEGDWPVDAAGHRGLDYFLFYYGMHQPRLRVFNLPEGGSYRIDVIDTWNMTITCAAEAASGHLALDLPGRKFMAVCMQKNI
jgi:hypothetical protein